MLTLLGFTFISGFVTILAPCIWPLLPIVLSSTATGGKRKPFGITFGLILSFSISVLTLSYLIKFIAFDPNLLRYFSVAVIFILGFCLLIPALSSKLEYYVSILSGKINPSHIGTVSNEGFYSGLITGISLGLVWTPCAGPILATIATLAATQQVNSNVVLVTAVYSLGVGIPLFIFASLGAKLFDKLRSIGKYTQKLQQVFGAVMILTALAILTGYDKIIQVKLLNAFPSYSNFIYNLESGGQVEDQLNSLNSNLSEVEESTKLFKIGDTMLNFYPTAPELVGINNWLNTEEPLSLEKLKGKVVLIDFWTYTCINCIRTLPHVTSWYNKYKDNGFIVIGVHTPEFEFEKKTENVEYAIKTYDIKYPVAQDNDYATWRAYNNRYWPAHYLIDAQGKIRRTHFGEGEYDETEKAIQELLLERGEQVEKELIDVEDQTPRTSSTPETYLGLGRMRSFGSDQIPGTGDNVFTLSKPLSLNEFAYEGNWTLGEEYARAGDKASLTINFRAGKVFLVITPAESGDTIEVELNGEQISSNNSGADVRDGVLILDSPRLYTLVDFKGEQSQGLLKLKFPPGTEVYAFTFGS